MIYLIANWKAVLTLKDCQEWMTTFISHFTAEQLDEKLQEKNIKIIICPPNPLLYYVKNQCSDLRSVELGAQHVSPHTNGAYTGEVTAEILKDFVSYAIVGHSEMRKFDHLEESEIQQILERCKEQHIKTILCIRNEKDKVYSTDIIAYEPVDAIGNGNNATVTDVMELKNSLQLPSETMFLYGGSVSEENVSHYLNEKSINGLLIGTSSRQAEKFLKLVYSTLA
jgi:triosephosphate isomerase